MHEVGRGPAPTAAAVVDAGGGLVIPGFVAGHHHLYQGISRGIHVPGGLLSWLAVHYRAWSRLTEDDVRRAATASLAQLALGGCTTVSAFEYLHPADSDFVTPVIEAARAVGLRLQYVRGCAPRLEGTLADELSARGADIGRLVEDEGRVLSRTAEVLAQPSSDVLRWACGPTTPVLDDGGDFHRALTAVADRFGAPMHVHLHPLTGTCREGESVAAAVGRLGLLREGNWFAHGSRLTPADVADLGAAGVGIVHNPSCSVLLGYPIPPLAEWSAVNERVGLSVDGAASNDRGSMLAEAQLAWQLQHSHGRGLPAAEVMALATTGSARAIGWPELGSLHPDGPADLAVVDLRSLEYSGTPTSALSDPAALLVRTHGGGRMAHVLVGGRLVVHDGRLTGVDERDASRLAGESARRLYDHP